MLYDKVTRLLPVRSSWGTIHILHSCNKTQEALSMEAQHRERQKMEDWTLSWLNNWVLKPHISSCKALGYIFVQKGILFSITFVPYLINGSLTSELGGLSLPIAITFKNLQFHRRSKVVQQLSELWAFPCLYPAVAPGKKLFMTSMKRSNNFNVHAA